MNTTPFSAEGVPETTLRELGDSAARLVTLGTRYATNNAQPVADYCYRTHIDSDRVYRVSLALRAAFIAGALLGVRASRDD